MERDRVGARRRVQRELLVAGRAEAAQLADHLDARPGLEAALDRAVEVVRRQLERDDAGLGVMRTAVAPSST